jgi:hypothetical protein
MPKIKTYLKPGTTNLTALASDPNGTAAYNSANANAGTGKEIKREFVVRGADVKT